MAGKKTILTPEEKEVRERLVMMMLPQFRDRMLAAAVNPCPSTRKELQDYFDAFSKMLMGLNSLSGMLRKMRIEPWLNSETEGESSWIN